MGYLSYKVYNSFLFDFKGPPRCFPLLYGSFECCDDDSVLFSFDLSHRNTHLGDSLFFFPLFSELFRRDVAFDVLASQSIYDLFVAIYGTELPRNRAISFGGLVLNVFPKPAFSDLYLKKPNSLVVDFADASCSYSIVRQLINSFAFFMRESFEDALKVPVRKHCLTPELLGLLSGKKCVIFNNYIDSGHFRKYFVDSSKLDRKCIQYRNNGYVVIHVGSASDKKSDARCYSFVDYDMRGRLTFGELVSLMASNEVLACVSFDNFIAHLSSVYKKKLYVLFRGRFSLRQYRHHILCVNNAFENENMVYL